MGLYNEVARLEEELRIARKQLSEYYNAWEKADAKARDSADSSARWQGLYLSAAEGIASAQETIEAKQSKIEKFSQALGEATERIDELEDSEAELYYLLEKARDRIEDLEGNQPINTLAIVFVVEV